jgi:hypothetical protein
VFSLTHGSAPRAEALGRPYVRGASVRAYWRDFEPQEGRFTWDLFDETLARARAQGKQAAFRVMNGTGTPEWVYAAGAQTYDPQDRGVRRLPLPWDDVFHEKWRAFVAALGRRYDGQPGVAYVAMSMPAGHWAELLFPVALPAVEGYSAERFVAAHRRVIEAYLAAFPRTPLTLAITGHEYDGSLQRVVGELTDWIVARLGPDNPRLLIQANGWSERTVMGRNTTVDRTFDSCFAKPIRRGLQQIAGDSWTLRQPPDTRMGDQLLANAVLLRCRAQYAEVYEGDVAGERVQPALAQLGALLERRAYLDAGGRLHADEIDQVDYTTDLSDPRSSPAAVRVAGGDGGEADGAARPLFGATAYVRYVAYERGKPALAGGYPWFGPALFEPGRRTCSVPGARRLRYTSDGSYPVPIRPDWAVSRSAVTIEGDTLDLGRLLGSAGTGSRKALRVVPVVEREDGKEALGDVYELGAAALEALDALDGAAGGGAGHGAEQGALVVPPLAAVEDLGQKE